MKKVILATFALSTFLLIACNSNPSDKNNSKLNNEIEHMELGTQYNESDHMTQGGVHEKHTTLNVKGSCEMCKERIEKAAKEVEGVSFASWDTEKQVLHLNYDSDKATEDDISKALAAAGHDTDKYKAEQAVYDALPACCKYRE